MKTTLVKVQRKGAINIPAEIRTEAGLAKGDMLEAKLQNGRIILVPKSITNRVSAAGKGSRGMEQQKPAIAKKKRSTRKV